MPQKIDNKSFFKMVVFLVLPIALQNLINVGMQAINVFMLGRVTETALSASSLAGQIQFVMMLFFFGLSSGSSVLTAQYWGKGDTRTIEKVMIISLRFSMAVALLFSLAALLVPTFLMRIFTPDPLLIEEGARYLRLVAPGYLCVAFTTTYLNTMRSMERVLVSVVIFSISFVTNIVFNSIFIFGLLGLPPMGIAGAGIASTLSRVIEVIIVICYAVRNPDLRIRKKDLFEQDSALFKDFMKYAIPTTVTEMVWGLAVSAIAIIIGHLGAAAVAANSVTMAVRQLASVSIYGVSNATAIIVGKAMGSGNPDQALAYAKRLIQTGVLAGLLGSAFILGVRPFVSSLMNLSPEANDLLMFQLLITSLYVLSQAITTTMSVGIFRAGGDPRFGLISDIIFMWGGSILWGALGAFVFGWPVKLVLAILIMDETIKVPFTYLRYRQRRWLRNLTR